MQHYFSRSTGGYYNEEHHADAMPPDVVAVPQRLYEEASSRSLGISINARGELAIAEPRDLVLTEEEARQQRNALLTASDWTEGRSISDEIFELWRPYRQALRDLPAQPGFPEAIEWPTPPA
jgi:hypothetical protein